MKRVLRNSLENFLTCLIYWNSFRRAQGKWEEKNRERENENKPFVEDAEHANRYRWARKIIFNVIHFTWATHKPPPPLLHSFSQKNKQKSFQPKTECEMTMWKTQCIHARTTFMCNVRVHQVNELPFKLKASENCRKLLRFILCLIHHRQHSIYLSVFRIHSLTMGKSLLYVQRTFSCDVSYNVIVKLILYTVHFVDDNYSNRFYQFEWTKEAA